MGFGLRLAVMPTYSKHVKTLQPPIPMRQGNVLPAQIARGPDFRARRRSSIFVQELLA